MTVFAPPHSFPATDLLHTATGTAPVRAMVSVPAGGGMPLCSATPGRGGRIRVDRREPPS